jgi:hypothetical protein
VDTSRDDEWEAQPKREPRDQPVDVSDSAPATLDLTQQEERVSRDGVDGLWERDHIAEAGGRALDLSTIVHDAKGAPSDHAARAKDETGGRDVERPRGAASSAAVDHGWSADPADHTASGRPDDVLSRRAGGSSDDVDSAVATARRAVLDAIAEAEVSHPIERVDVVSLSDGTSDDHVNEAQRVEIAGDGAVGFLKPQFGETPGVRYDVRVGSQWQREVATYDLDQALGLESTPRTRAVLDRRNLYASFQDEVPFESKPVSEYPPDRVERMAVLDYVIANSDRHSANYRTDAEGLPRAIDNGYSFPAGDSDPIRSDFVAAVIDKPLHDDLVAHLRTVDDASVLAALDRSWIEPEAQAGVLARLDEIRTFGRITGAAWRGEIVRADLSTVRSRRDST